MRTSRPRHPGRRAAALLLALLPLLARGASGEDVGPSVVESLRAQARAKAAAKDVLGALALYFSAIREAEDYVTKGAIRDEVLALPPAAARPQTPAERATVDARIAEERDRDVIQRADALERKGLVLAAYALRERLQRLAGISEQRAQEIARANEGIARRLLDQMTDEEKAEAKEVEGAPTDVEAAFDRARKAAAAGRAKVALRVLKNLTYSAFAAQDLKDRAAAEIAAVRARFLAALSDAERAAVEEVWEDPHWKGLATSESHEFVYIGPREFVTTISAADRIRMDLACVLLGDLVGRDVTGNGHRITVYYKERLDFPGGMAGGQRIDIGKPVIAKPIAGELHFHELSHCAFDVGMAYPGFVEGIANFGAIFVLDALGRPAEAEAAIQRNRQSYEADYLQRRVRYFRIQSYAPSCGLLLSPISGRDAAARRAEWALYRAFFRRLRAWMPDEPRDAERARHFAWLWEKAFGRPLLDEAARARWPVAPRDRQDVPDELDHWWARVGRGERYAGGGFLGDAEEDLRRVIEGCHDGEVKDRAKFAMAPVKEGLGDPAARDALYRELGVIARWKLCLPFYSRGISPLYPVHAPERAIDLDATYPDPMQAARWVDAKPTPDGRVDLLQYGVGYPDDAACCAVVDLEVPADEPDAVLRVGFDDVCAAWLDGELLEKWESPTGWVRDHHSVAMPLAKGRHRLLLKVVNRSGAWGFSARVARADRSPIPGLALLDPPAKAYPPSRAEPKAQKVVLIDMEKARALPRSRIKVAAGTWEAADDVLRLAAPGAVLWRKFQIVPFGSKDPPDGLFWLADKDLPALTDFAVEMAVRSPRDGLPRVAVTFHGEERDDGLSGHTFVLREGGEGVDARLEEYDRIVYQGTTTLARAREHVLRFVRLGRKLSCYVDGKPVLEDVDLPPLPRPGIGVMTWSRETGIAWLRVDRLGGK